MQRGGKVAVVGAAVLALTAAGVGLAGSASAHVTVHSVGATQGGYAVVTFQVPTESDTASTTALKVQLPQDHPIASVSVQPHAGWSYKVTTAKLPTPITTDDGQLTEAVSEIDWTADSAATAIKPGQFDQFNISAGPLPKVSSLTFKAIQTYSDGKIVSWIEVPAPGSSAEPQHPAPTLQLAAAAGDSSGSSSAPTTDAPGAGSNASGASGKASSGAATTGIVLGIVGVVLGAAALVLSLRRRPSGS